MIDARIVKSRKSKENNVCPRMALTTCRTVRRARILRLKSLLFVPSRSFNSWPLLTNGWDSSFDVTASFFSSVIPSISTRFDAVDRRLSMPRAQDSGRMNTFDPGRIPISARRNSSRMTSECWPNSAKQVMKKCCWSSESIYWKTKREDHREF